MTGRRSTHVSLMEDQSDQVTVVPRLGNAQVTGRDFGWFKIDHDRNLQQVRVRFYGNRDDAAEAHLAESSLINVALLPATITLAEVNGSGVTASIQVRGVLT